MLSPAEFLSLLSGYNVHSKAEISCDGDIAGIWPKTISTVRLLLNARALSQEGVEMLPRITSGSRLCPVHVSKAISRRYYSKGDFFRYPGTMLGEGNSQGSITWIDTLKWYKLTIRYGSISEINTEVLQILGITMMTQDVHMYTVYDDLLEDVTFCLIDWCLSHWLIFLIVKPGLRLVGSLFKASLLWGSFIFVCPIPLIGRSKTNKEDQIVDITDVSSESRYHPYFDTGPETNDAMENLLSTMSLPDTEYNKTRSVTSNSNFQSGESSRIHSFSYRLAESFDINKGFRGENLEGTETPRPSQKGQAPSIRQKHHRNLGAEDDVELDVFIRRALGPSLTDVRLTDEIPKLGKGKQPIQPSLINLSLLGGKIDRNDESTQPNDKDKQPLRSVLIQALSPYKTSIKHDGNARLAFWNQLNPRSFMTSDQYSQDQCDRGHKIEEYSNEQGGSGRNSDSKDDCSETSQENEYNNHHDNADVEFNKVPDSIRNEQHGPNISLKHCATPQTNQHVFLLVHDTVIPGKGTNKFWYGDAIPGKLLQQKKSPFPSTSAFLMALSKSQLDNLGIKTAHPEMIRTLILEDAEEAYRKATYGSTPWLGIIRERKNRYDPETRSWKSVFYPAQWRQHGLVLPEPPMNSCKFRMVTLCGQILHQWYVRCDKSRAFGPRDIVAKISCGQDGKCEKSPRWVPENGSLMHNNSVKCWTEIDPDEKGVESSKEFYPFMKFWIIEGPPKEEPPPGCMKINCITKCGLVKSRIRLLCHRHISKTPKCIGDEFTMLIDRGCGIRDDIHRCDEKTICAGYLDWVGSNIGLPLDELTPRQLDGLGKLHANLSSAYEQEKKGMGSFLIHEYSEKGWKDMIYNHVDMYNMLFDWGLKTIRYPKDLSVIQASARDIDPQVDISE